jgi:hypothetical protein
MREPKQQQILFFVDGPAPSAADFAAAEALGTKCFRNARKAGSPPRDGCRCAGAVPPAYVKAKNVTVLTVPPPKAGQPDKK